MNNTNQYLDLYGLHYYNEKLKKYVDDKEVKTDDVTISKNASGELEVTGHLKRLIDNVYVPRPQEIAIITGVKITGDSNNITITGGTLELPEGSISSQEFSTTSGFVSELKTSGIKFPNSGVINNATLENTTVSGDLNFTQGNIINPSTIQGVDNITFNNLGDITFSGKTQINQNSISTETVDAEYLQAGDTSTNRCTFISSEGISFIPTGMQISPTTISGVDNIQINSNSGVGLLSFNNGNTYIRDNSIESSGIVAKESLGVGGNLMSRYTPAVYITPQDITFLRNGSGSINNINSINMSSGSINGLTNINTVSGKITDLDSIHFHSGGTFISGVSIKVNSEGTLDTPPLNVSGIININKIGGYGGSQSVITNNEITTFHGTYYEGIEVGSYSGSKLVVHPENINFYLSTLGGTLENVHAINMNNGLISGISDIYSSTGEINLHSGNINMYNGKISGIQDIGFYYQTGIEISQSGIKGSLNSGIQINGTLKMTDPDNAGISDITFINMVSGVIHMDDGTIQDVDEINGHQASFTTGLFDTIGTAQQNILNVNCAVKFSGVITGGNFSNLVLDDHITYGGSNNIFTQEYIDQLKNALGIN